jgi:predicted MFS family arabinose efflux permease
LGSLVAERVIARLGKSNTLVLMIILNAISKLWIVFFPNFHIVALLVALNNFGGYVFNILAVSTRQSLIPDQLRGRVNSAFRLFIFGTAPIGAMLGGLVGKTLGLPMVYLLGAVLVVVAALYARFVIAGLFDAAVTPKIEDDFAFEY